MIGLEVPGQVRGAQHETRHGLVRRSDLIGPRYSQRGFDHAPVALVHRKKKRKKKDDDGFGVATSMKKRLRLSRRRCLHIRVPSSKVRVFHHAPVVAISHRKKSKKVTKPLSLVFRAASIAILELQHYLQPTRSRLTLCVLGFGELLLGADDISAPLDGSKVPNGIRSG